MRLSGQRRCPQAAACRRALVTGQAGTARNAGHGESCDRQSQRAVYVYAGTAALRGGRRRTSTSGMEVSSSSNELYCAAMAGDGDAYSSSIAPTHTRALPVRAIIGIAKCSSAEGSPRETGRRRRRRAIWDAAIEEVIRVTRRRRATGGGAAPRNIHRGSGSGSGDWCRPWRQGHADRRHVRLSQLLRAAVRQPSVLHPWGAEGLKAWHR